MSKFGWSSTTDEVLEGIDLSGRVAVVTGVSSGLGVETARALAAHGAEIVGAARDLAKAKAATEAVASGDGGRLSLVELDLADLESVRRAADQIGAGGRPIDLIIANAGVMATPHQRTADGFELQFGANHLGHFVLVNRLAHLLAPGARVISLSSSAHAFSDVDLDDANYERRPYDPIAAYGASKTANALFAVEFDRRHAPRGIRAASVHPGGILTGLARHMTSELIDQMIAASAAASGNSSATRGYKTVPQGAATTVWAAVAAPAALVGGRYCEDCAVAEVAASGGGVRPYALDPVRGERLWRLSEDLVGERFQ
jgi:NAD(P)-dependent dehydrogenase (short-subunit alcohol dehydrogenase family)